MDLKKELTVTKIKKNILSQIRDSNNSEILISSSIIFTLIQKGYELTKQQEDEIKHKIKIVLDTMLSEDEIVEIEGKYYLHPSDIERIEPDEVFIFKGEPPYYEIIIRNKTIKLNLDEMTTSTAFRKKYFALFKVMPKSIKADDWCEIITKWVQNAETKQVEELTDDIETIESVLSYIKNCKVSNDIKLCVDNRTLYKDNNGSLFVPNDTVRAIIYSLNSKITLRKMSFILKDYLKTGSKIKKVDGENKRFWNFDINKVNMEEEMTYKGDEDEQE